MSQRFVDSNGAERVGNRWGYNSYVTQEGAERAARFYLGGKGHWFIWRLADGSFDFSAVADPRTSGHPADLVAEVTVP